MITLYSGPANPHAPFWTLYNTVLEKAPDTTQIITPETLFAPLPDITTALKTHLVQDGSPLAIQLASIPSHLTSIAHTLTLLAEDPELSVKPRFAPFFAQWNTLTPRHRAVITPEMLAGKTCFWMGFSKTHPDWLPIIRDLLNSGLGHSIYLPYDVCHPSYEAATPFLNWLKDSFPQAREIPQPPPLTHPRLILQKSPSLEAEIQELRQHPPDLLVTPDQPDFQFQLNWGLDYYQAPPPHSGLRHPNPRRPHRQNPYIGPPFVAQAPPLFSHPRQPEKGPQKPHGPTGLPVCVTRPCSHADPHD